MTSPVPAQEESNELYDVLPEDIRRQLRRADQRKTVPKGTRLITQGIAPKDLVILETGSVEVSLRAGKKALSLTIAGAGRVFGLREILFQALPEVDVICREECGIRLVPGATVREILGSRPQTCLAIARILSVDLQMAESLLRRVPRRTNRRALTPVVLADKSNRS